MNRDMRLLETRVIRRVSRSLFSMVKVKVAVIGGSGLDNPDILEDRQEKFVDTPYGKPSDALILGKISGVDCVLLARHGRKHTIGPSQVNYRANVHALQAEGCTHLLVTTACGSLQEDIHPGDLVLIDQFIDRTHKRIQSFYNGGVGDPPGISHIPMNEPFCPRTRKVLEECIRTLGFQHKPAGTMLTIEGPRFSSRAESKLWQSWGAHVVNMSTVPEVVLANEAGLCYASIALVTDYDSWRDHGEHVTVEMALKTLRENGHRACSVLKAAIPKLAAMDWEETIAQYKERAKSAVM